MESSVETAGSPTSRSPAGATAIVKSGFYEGLEVALDRPHIVIGRGRKAHVSLAEATISRSHAVLGFDGEGFFVEDLGSTNGTLVNGSKVARQRLATEDEIRMIVDRWRVARMLHAGKTYRDIESATGLSSRTIARISRWVKEGEGGYRRQLGHHSPHA